MTTRTAAIPAAMARETAWDAIVIGAGMGGAAAAYGLARRGLKVLVIEKGLAELTETSVIGHGTVDPAARTRIAHWPTKLSGNVDDLRFDFFAPLGCGAGGSSALYAAALDRFRPADFAPRPHPGGGMLEWPLGYDDFAPWYAEAERLLEVSGGADPLDTASETGHLGAPPDLSPRDADIARRFEAAGLHPYRLHSGYRFAEDCGPCLGRVCLKDCKRHGGNSFLDPARASGNAAVLGEAEVVRLEADTTRVLAVHVRVDGQEMRLRARHFALAAGTYFSPVLLLRSAGEAWPDGLGNRHGQVGRNLMFHTGRSLAIWSTRRHGHQGPGKSLALRDFYETPEGKFGEIQSTGAEARYGNVVYALRQMLATSRFARVPLLWHLARIPAFAASRLLGDAAVFELIMEDLPYPDNRIALDPEAPAGMRFHYAVRDELRQRFDAFSGAVSARLKGMRHMWLNHGLALNYGHPMGTCRIGHDPATSVADAGGRVHGLENLYIADGAFMPTSGGTNPSLTIAAHGLRVGAAMAA